MAPHPMPGENLNTDLNELEPIFCYREESDPIDSYFQGIIVMMLSLCLLSLLYCLIF